MKKIYLFVGVVVLLVGAYFIFVDEPEEVAQNLSPIRIGYNIGSLTHASVIIAYEKEYFQKHGISPEMISLKGGRQVMQALAAGQIDLGLGGVTHFMLPMAKGAPIKCIAFAASSPGLIYVRPNENLDSLSDLYGKTISVGVTGVNFLNFKAAMDQEGIDTDKMEFADIEDEYLTIALMEQKVVDAVIVAAQDKWTLINAGAVILPEWESKGYIKKSRPRSSIVINSEFLNQKESLVEGFLEALIDSHRLIKDNSSEAAEIIVNHNKEGSNGAIAQAPEKIVEQWENGDFVNMIWQDTDVTMELVKMAKETGILEEELNTEDIFDLRFESKLETAQKEIYGETN